MWSFNTMQAQKKNKLEFLVEIFPWHVHFKNSNMEFLHSFSFILK